jgi:hypothetical protein
VSGPDFATLFHGKLPLDGSFSVPATKRVNRLV